MKILILGGTGAMGIHLTRILKQAGEEVFVTSRKNRQNGEGVTYLCGNAHDVEFLSTILGQKPWDAIVDFMTYTTSEFQGRVKLLLSNTKQYIFLSSSRVYAESKTPIREDSPLLLDTCEDKEYLATDEYALKKARQENILRHSGKNNWTIIRPYVTFSENRLQLSALEKEYWLYRAMHGRTIVFSEDLAQRTTTFTYGYDVAKGIVSIIGKDSAFGHAYHITNTESHTWYEILEQYLAVIEEKTGKRPKVLMLKSWKSFMGGNKYQVRWDRLYDRTFDNSSINQYIDTSQFKPTIPALSSCLIDFMATPKFKKINWGSEAMKDRLTKEWADFGEIRGVKQKIKYYLIRLGMYQYKRSSNL